MGPDELQGRIVFRRYLPVFLALNGCVILAGLICLVAAAISGPWWWAGVVACVGLGVAHALSYANTVVMVEGLEVTIRRGALRYEEESFDIWRHDLRIEQSLVGASFDVGSVCFVTEHGVFRVRGIANVSILRTLIARRRRLAIELLAPARQSDRRGAQTAITETLQSREVQ